MTMANTSANNVANDDGLTTLANNVGYTLAE